MEDNISNGNLEIRVLGRAQLNRFDGIRDGTGVLLSIGGDDGIDNVFSFLIGLHPLDRVQE